MKTNIANRNGQQATVMLICLMSALIIGITLASYLVMSQQEYVSVRRSQTWNRTIPVTEAGVEDALALINKYGGTGTPITSWTNTASSDGWSLVDNNVYHVMRYVGDDYYNVYLTNLNNSPAILSIATLVWNYKYASAPQTMFASVGVTTPGPANTSRAVLVQTAPPHSYFLFGILARKGVSISGGGTNDSVNSLDPNYAANPWSMALEHANGDIGTVESNVTAAASSSSSTIYGHVHTGPASTVTVSGGSGGIGDISWVANNGGQIEPGWTDNTLNIAIPDAAPVPSVTKWPMPGAINNTYTLSGSPGTITYYQPTAGMNIGGGATVLITNGAVGLICAGSFTISGGSGISIANGSSLVAYFNGTTTLSGRGVINATGNATNCTFYGEPNCTSLTYSGSSSFIGTVYAPEAAYTQSGGSGFIGAMVVYSYTQSGGKSLFRYDEALGGGGANSVYRVISWQEVQAQ